jgi:outer membrane receptor for ferrienterochelin and colicin
MGLVKSSLTLEGPVIKDKSSIMISARRTWIDGFIAPLTNQVGIYFYDINAKGNYIINNNNRVYLSFYTGRDQIRYSQDDAYLRARWGNTIGSAKWNTVLNPKLFMNTIFTYSQFRYELKDKNQVIDSGFLSTLGNYVGVSSIQDVSAQLQFQWYPGYRHHIEAGGNYSHTNFVPTALEGIDDQVGFPVKRVDNSMQSNEVTVYAEDEIKLGEKWVLRPGLHWSNWFSGDFSYSSLQPRVFASYKPNGRNMYYASFSHMAQFLHLINNNSYGLPTDFWVPSTRNIKPEEAFLATIGYAGNTKGYKYSLEAYYKDIDGTIVYTTGKTIFDNSARWQDKIEQGRGWSYGAELSAEKKWGPLSVSLAYTLSWNWRRFANINGGKAFPYRYDRRHNLKIVMNYKLAKGIKINANWLFMSGEAFTLPDQVYPDFDNNLLISPGRTTSTSYTYHYSDWNSYRLPPIHRLDIGVNFTKIKKQHLVRTWSLGVFNVYGRPNVMFVTLANDETDGTLKLQGISMLQFIPYVSYKLSF